MFSFRIFNSLSYLYVIITPFISLSILQLISEEHYFTKNKKYHSLQNSTFLFYIGL